MVGLHPLVRPSGGASVGRRRAYGVPSASHPNKAWRVAGHIRAQALLDRPPPHWLAEQSLDGAVHIASPHRLFPLREDTDDRLQHPVVPGVPGPDWRTLWLASAAVRAIFGTGTLGTTIRAPSQQGFQGSRRVGMVSG